MAKRIFCVPNLIGWRLCAHVQSAQSDGALLITLISGVSGWVGCEHVCVCDSDPPAR